MSTCVMSLQKWIATYLTLTILAVLTLSCMEQSLITPTLRIPPTGDGQSTIAPTVQIRPTSEGAYKLPALSKTALPAAAGISVRVVTV